MLFFFFFSLPAHNTFHERKIQIEPFSTSAGEGKQTGQTGYNGPATREAKLARRWGIYIGFSRPDSDLLGIRPSVLPSLLFPPSIDASSPPSTTVAPLRPRRTNKSFVDPGGGGMADRQARGRGKARTPKREKQRGGRVVEWDESEDRLLSDTGRACKLIERRRRRVDCVQDRARYNMAASFPRFKLDSFECLRRRCYFSWVWNLMFKRRKGVQGLA